MSMLSPAATYSAELREQLGSVGRALTLQRGLIWLARGLVMGMVALLAVVVWAWTREGVATLPLAGLVALPVATGLLAAMGSLFLRHRVTDLARRVDTAARLQERSMTALELGARGEEFPLALAQMRDAIEHLKRVDLLDAFPLRVPRNELMAAFFVGVIALLVAISPNPWLLRQRASNPAITIAREQAQRIQRLADSIQPQDSAELEALRQLVAKGARTIEVRSNEPDAALNSLQDLEEQLRQMSAGDDQLAAALAAIASALAADPATQEFASAINTGDMREIAQAARNLAQSTTELDGQDQQRVSKVLRDASNRAGRVSQSVAGELGDAADALEGAAGDEGAEGQMSDGAQQPGQGRQGGASPSNGRSANDALNQLANSAAAAGERSRAASQLESSRNALDRALGRTQSRSGSSGRSSSTNQRSQGAGNSQTGEQGQGAGQGNTGDQGEGADGNGGTPGGNQGDGGDTGQGGGYSAGGQSQNRTGASGGLDAITRAEQVPGGAPFAPDEAFINPYLGEAGEGEVRTSEESVQPTFSRKTTTGNDSATIPLGLRDLVKDYFSSLDQK